MCVGCRAEPLAPPRPSRDADQAAQRRRAHEVGQVATPSANIYMCVTSVFRWTPCMWSQQYKNLTNHMYVCMYLRMKPQAEDLPPHRERAGEDERPAQQVHGHTSER